VAACSSCERELDPSFRYCPWCGEPRRRHEERDAPAARVGGEAAGAADLPQDSQVECAPTEPISLHGVLRRMP
jgi:hypothetical protein